MTKKRVATGVPVRSPPSDPAVATANQWVEIGPAVIMNGAATRVPRVNGCFRALAIHRDGFRVYAASALGGVWYSGDGGTSWAPIDFYASVRDGAGQLQPADALTVGAIAVKWGGGPDTDVVYVGPGTRPPTGNWAKDTMVQGIGIRVATGPASAAAVRGPAAADPWVLEATDLRGVSVNALALDIADGVVWAATTLGLYKRPAGGGAAWQRVDTGLGASDISSCVVIVPGLAGEVQRIYVASANGRLARSVDGLTWQAITLPADAARPLPAITAVHLVAGNVPGIVWALADGPRLWRIDGDAAEVVADVPVEIFRRDDAEGLPGLALAVHPQTDARHQDVIALAGGGTVGGFAALFTGKVTRVGAALTFPRTAPAGGLPDQWTGDGLPSGVRALSWPWGAGTPQSHLWVAGDRGLLRSVKDGERHSFIERNTGLSASDATMLAQASGTDAISLLGVRGGRALRRISAETWEVLRDPTLPLVRAAGGGVAVDNGDTRRLYAQVRRATWQCSTDGGRNWAAFDFLTAPAGLVGAARNTWESARAEELGSANATGRIAIVTGDDASRGTQLALGTDRIWYSDEERKRAAAGTVRRGWVTLPTATDPFDPTRPDAPNRLQDRLPGPVVTACWGTPDRLYVLTRGGVHLLERRADSSWHLLTLYDQAATHRNWKGKVPRGQIPPELDLASLAIHQPGNGNGTVYVGTSGKGDEEHLWWFDGSNTWASAGLGIDTSVHAVAVDPDHPEVVYAGTDAGVHKGTLTRPGGVATWAWSRYSGGLPEAPCVDLLVHRPDGGARPFLRAALCGRGLWEIALDGRAQGPEVYVRAHAFDVRRDEVAAGGAHDPIRLDASPDVRVWRASAAPPPDPIQFFAAAPYFRPGADLYDIWLVKSALRAAGYDVDPESAFEVDPARHWTRTDDDAVTALRAGLAAPLPATPMQLWHAILNGNPLPLESNPPDHADVAAHIRDEPDRWPKGRRPSTATSDLARVYVTVHARHWHPIDRARVSVALLRTAYQKHRSLFEVTLPPGWVADLILDSGRAQAARGGWLAGTNWSYADATESIRSIPASLDPIHPQVVAFDVNLAGGSTWNKGWVLLAVVLADDDLVATLETDVARLVRTSRYVAARSVRKAARIADPGTRYAGMDISGYPGLVVMDQAWANSNIVWTGLYLDSPAPEPALGDAGGGGHNRNGPRAPWMNAWPEIHPDWGIAVIYWGQQGPGAGAGPHVLTAAPPAGAPPAAPGAIAVANAADASRKAGPLPPGGNGAGVSPGAVIYLDFEDSGAPGAAALDYCSVFFHALAEYGFRPGLYGHGIVIGPPPAPGISELLRARVPGLFAWNVRYRPSPPPANAWRVRGGQLTFDTARPVALDDPRALLRQWAQENPPGSPLPALRNETGAIVPNPVSAGFRPDLDLGFLQDPAFPERHPLPDEILEGRVSVTASDPRRCAIYTVRRGRPCSATWTPGANDPRQNLSPPAGGVKWNPFAVPAALRVPGPPAAPAATDIFLAFGAADAEDPAAQRLQALRRLPESAWERSTVPDAGLVLDPLPGVAASTRTDRSIEVFAVDDDSGLIAGARFTSPRGWTSLSLLPNIGAADQVRRTNRPAVVSRGPDLLDLFWIGIDGLLRWSASPRPGAWNAAAQIGGGARQAHPLTNLVAVSRAADRLDIFFVGALVGGNDWRLCVVSWTQAGGWSAATIAVDPGAAPPNGIEPMSTIAACTRSADHADAFVVGMDGALYTTTLRPDGTWSPLALACAGPPLGIASIDGAICQGANDIEVVVTGRGGNVYATQWVDGLPGFIGFDHVRSLDL